MGPAKRNELLALVRQQASKGHICRAWFIGKLLIRYRDKPAPLPAALEALETAYQSKYIRLAETWSEADVARATEHKMSLRAALSLLPLDNLADSGHLRSDDANELRAARRKLITAFTNERGKTAAWSEEIAALLLKYSGGLSEGSRGQFLHQRHRAIASALETARTETKALRELLPEDAKADTKTADDILQGIEKLRRKLDRLRCALTS